MVGYLRSKRKHVFLFFVLLFWSTDPLTSSTSQTFGKFIIEGQHYWNPHNFILYSSCEQVRLNYEEMYCIKLYYIIVQSLQMAPWILILWVTWNIVLLWWIAIQVDWFVCWLNSLMFSGCLFVFFFAVVYDVVVLDTCNISNVLLE